MCRVSDQRVSQYQTEGYFTVPQLLKAAEIDILLRGITNLIERYPDVPDDLIQMEPSVVTGDKIVASRELGVRKLFHVAKYSDCFRRLAFHPRLLEIAQALLGSEILLLQSMTLMKPPEFSAIKVWHQDNAYFRVDPPDVVGFWIACDEATSENGCMHIVPRSHHLGIVEHSGRGDLYGAVESPNTESMISIPLQPGDALVFHGELLHFTPVNQTQKRRRAIQYHYASCAAQPISGMNEFEYDPELDIFQEGRSGEPPLFDK